MAKLAQLGGIVACPVGGCGAAFWEGPCGTTETRGLGPVKLCSTLTLCFSGRVAEGRPASQPPGSRGLVSVHTLSDVTVLLGHASLPPRPPLEAPGLVSTSLTEQTRCRPWEAREPGPGATWPSRGVEQSGSRPTDSSLPHSVLRRCRSRFIYLVSIRGLVCLSTEPLTIYSVVPKSSALLNIIGFPFS